MAEQFKHGDVVKKTVDYLTNDQFESTTSLSDVSNDLNISKFTICRCFQVIAGISPMRWFLVFRVCYASELMRNNPDQTIEEISYLAKFKNRSHFCRSFQNILGMTPSDFKSSFNFTKKEEKSPTIKKRAIIKTIAHLKNTYQVTNYLF